MGSGEGIKIVEITPKIEKVQWHNLYGMFGSLKKEESKGEESRGE